MWIELIPKEMSGIKNQVQKMYYEDGLGIAQIAESLGFEEASVALILNEKKPRGEDEKVSVVKSRLMELQNEAADVISELMQSAENEGVRLKAAVFAAEMAHGVKDTKKTAPMISIDEVNIVMQQAVLRHREQTHKVIELAAK